MASDYQRLIKEITELRRKLANMVRVGTVDQVSGDKLRVNMGKGDGGDAGGSGDVLSPWINHTNHRGEHRERQAFRKGQCVMFICPDGDPRQAILTSWAPNKKHKPPKHANESGVGEHTYQFGGFCKSRGDDGDDSWIGKDEGPGTDAGEERENSGGLAMGGGGGSGQGQQGQGGKQKEKRKTASSDDESTYVRRMNKEGGHTLRYKKDNRAAVHEKGAKLKAGDDNFSVVHKDGKLHQKAKEEYVGEARNYYVNSDDPRVKVPWKLGTKDAKDKIPDDNE